MPYGFGKISAGLFCAPSVQEMIQSYLTTYSTIGASNWDPGTSGVAGSSGNGAALFAPPSEISSAQWTGTVRQVCGLTALVAVNALFLAGSSGFTNTLQLAPYQSDTTAELRAPISYYPGDIPPQVGGILVPTFPWAPLVRINPNDWASIGNFWSGWCALPGCVAVGAWGISDPITFVPYTAQVLAGQYYNSFPVLYMLLYAVPGGKVGGPTIWLPLTWTARYVPVGGTIDEAEVWDQMRSDIGPALDCMEQGDVRRYQDFNSGPTSYRQGRAQTTRLGLRS